MRCARERNGNERQRRNTLHTKRTTFCWLRLLERPGWRGGERHSCVVDFLVAEGHLAIAYVIVAAPPPHAGAVDMVHQRRQARSRIGRHVRADWQLFVHLDNHIDCFLPEAQVDVTVKGYLQRTYDLMVRVLLV